MKRGGMAALVAVAAACSVSDAPLFEPGDNRPEFLAPGLFRLTFSEGGDYARGSLGDGTLLYRADDLAGLGSGVTLAAADPELGTTAEVAAAYRAALADEEMAHLAVGTGRRALLTLLPPEPRSHWCGDATLVAPAPPYRGWRLVALPLVDTRPLSSLYAPSKEFPVFTGAGRDATGGLFTSKRIRMIPPLAEAESLGTNPWGPALTPDGVVGFVSDGEVIWRYDLEDSTAVPVMITPGSYPVLTPDGMTLYVSRPNIIDSTVTVTGVLWSIFVSCVQTIVRYEIDGWTLVRRALGTGVEDTVTQGVEPVLLGDTAVVVRRADGLYRVSFAGVDTLLFADSGVAALARAGRWLAFTSQRFGNPEILLLDLN